LKGRDRPRLAWGGDSKIDPFGKERKEFTFTSKEGKGEEGHSPMLGDRKGKKKRVYQP